MGALSVTSNQKYQKPFAPLLPGVDVGKLNSFVELETLVHEDTCAVIVEPIQGEGGINVANVDWLKALRKRCDEVGAVLIFDEIQVSYGIGRGKWTVPMLTNAYSADCIGLGRSGRIQHFPLNAIPIS
jgi:acetylornithine/succinyldiaminopimelate/putrescine aminotransferase